MTKQDSTLLVASEKQLEIVNKYGNFKSACVILSPKNVQSSILKLSIRSNKQAYLAQSVSLAQFSLAYSKDNAYLMIETWLLDFNAFAGVNNKLDANQISQLAMLIYSEAYGLNFAELGLFFNRIKKGEYGQLYGAVDPIKIMVFLGQFLNQRQDSIEAINRESSDKTKQQTFEEMLNFSLTDEQRNEINTIQNNFIKQIKRIPITKTVITKKKVKTVTKNNKKCNYCGNDIVEVGRLFCSDTCFNNWTIKYNQ